MRPSNVLAHRANLRLPPRSRTLQAVTPADDLGEHRTLERKIRTVERPAPVRTARAESRPRNRGNGSRVGAFRVGKYQVVRRLHKGRISHVMLATTRGIGGVERTVAIKVLRSRFARDQRFVSGFLHEERVTGALHHPQMIRLLDSGESDYGPFMALEHIQGWNLERILRAARDETVPVPLHVALCLVHGVASGLHYLHERLYYQDKRIRMVHRDVQPANIMVTESGHIKLIDFGDVTIEGMERDQPNQLGVVGPYTPPEVVARMNVDRRADIYSLGALLYTLSTGYEPMPCDGSSQVARPSALCPGYAGDLEELVMRMLRPDVERRWQSVSSVILALEEVTSGYGLALSQREVGHYAEALMSKRGPEARGGRRARSDGPRGGDMEQTSRRWR